MYIADEDTLETLEPIERYLKKRLEIVCAARNGFVKGIKERSLGISWAVIGSKSSFKDVVLAKEKSYQEMSARRNRWSQFQRFLCQVTLHPMFEFFITACICINTIVLACYYHGIDPLFKECLDIVNWVSL